MPTTISFTRTSATPEVPAGTIEVFAHPTYGRITARYILNGNGSALAQGDLCRMKASQSNSSTVTTSATASLDKNYLRGVADHAIPDTYYGWIIIQGQCVIKGDGSVTVPTPLVADATAGRAKNYTAAPASNTAALAEALAVFGFALADDGAAGSTFSALLYGFTEA